MNFALILEFYFSFNVTKPANKLLVILLATFTYSAYFTNKVTKDSYFENNFKRLKLTKQKINEMESFLHQSSLMMKLVTGIFIICTILVSLNIGLESVPFELAKDSILMKDLAIISTLPFLYYLHKIIVYSQIIHLLNIKKFKKRKKQNSSQSS